MMSGGCTISSWVSVDFGELLWGWTLISTSLFDHMTPTQSALESTEAPADAPMAPPMTRGDS